MRRWGWRFGEREYQREEGKCLRRLGGREEVYRGRDVLG